MVIPACGSPGAGSEEDDATVPPEGTGTDEILAGVVTTDDDDIAFMIGMD